MYHQKQKQISNLLSFRKNEYAEMSEIETDRRQCHRLIIMIMSQIGWTTFLHKMCVNASKIQNLSSEKTCSDRKHTMLNVLIFNLGKKLPFHSNLFCVCHSKHVNRVNAYRKLVRTFEKHLFSLMNGQ